MNRKKAFVLGRADYFKEMSLQSVPIPTVSKENLVCLAQSVSGDRNMTQTLKYSEKVSQTWK